MKKCVLVSIVSILLLAAVLAGCGNRQAQEPTLPNAAIQDTTGETEAAEESAEPSTEPEESVPLNCVVISTPYGNLQYQDQWAEFLRTEQVNDGDNLVVTFYSEINSVRYELFGLTIGTQDGNVAGQITDGQGVQRNVYVHVGELAETDTLTESERNRLFAMQEEINYVLDNLK